jgi:hypothetical protein
MVSLQVQTFNIAENWARNLAVFCFLVVGFEQRVLDMILVAVIKKLKLPYLHTSSIIPVTFSFFSIRTTVPNLGPRSWPIGYVLHWSECP